MNVASMTQRQWYSRGEDEKFASLEALHEFLSARRSQSGVVKTPMNKLIIRPDDNDVDDIVMEAAGGIYRPTNWSFTQLCSLAAAHPSFLRELPAKLTAPVLNHCIQKHAGTKELGLLVQKNGHDTLRATTSAVYGRIWDNQLSQAAMEIIDRTGDRFYSPHDWGKEKRALFASDRDCHMLFIDGGSIVDAGFDLKGQPEQLNRGWIIGNSEVGLSSWYMAAFLFRWVCGNFAIHGLEDVQFMRIIHSANAPSKFVQEALPVLDAYTQASPKPLEAIIKRAKDKLLPKPIREFDAYFKVRGFTNVETLTAKLVATKEEGGADTLWQMVNGFTKSAQRIKYRDQRRNLETKAGALLELVA